MVFTPSVTVAADAAAAFCSWLTFTASVALTPSATPAMRPSLYTFTLPLMVVVSPNSFTDAPWPLANSATMPPIAPKVSVAPPLLMVSISFRFLFSSTLTLVPSLLTLTFLSPLKSTLSPGFTLVAAVATPLVDKFQPLLAFPAASSTFFSWLTFTASSLLTPAATPLILPSWSKETLLLITV